MDKATARRVLDLLREAYPDAACTLDHQDPFELLVATMLSAQTTDKRVNLVTPALFRKYPDARAFSAADPEDVGELIRSIGIFRNKAKNIVKMSKKLVEEFDGRVPEDLDLLQKLPGVGRKTANVVLADGFGEQRIAVDTHVFRVANRVGLAHAKDVRQTEDQLMQILPEKRWTEAHHELITHGRECCAARGPSCGSCCLAEICEKNGL